MSNEITMKTKFNAFQGQVNIALFNDIIGFIAGAATDNSSRVLRHLASTHIWYSYTQNDNIQKNYGFRYFGELLERYEERFGSDIADIRAIALAMAYTKDLLADEMFVGRQKDNFLRKITGLAETDLYLKGALYQLNKDEACAQEMFVALQQVTHTKTEELIFALSLFDDYEQTFTVFKPQLICLLGSERTIEISGNENIFCWMMKYFRQNSWLKGIRSKDIALFRAISELPVSFVKADSKHHETMLNNGYTAKDVVHLNSAAVRYKPTHDTMDVNSIVAEKIAIEMCETFINCEQTHAQDVYEHLEWLLQSYDSFAIKLSGYTGICKAIKHSIKPANPQTFLWLYKLTRQKNSYSSDSKLPDDVFHFDVMDEKWDSLGIGLDIKDYRRLFDNQLMYKSGKLTREQLEERILKYDTLTGMSYLALFEADFCWTHSDKFALMVEHGIIDLIAVFESKLWPVEFSEHRLKEKKPPMVEYIERYINKIRSRKAFEFIRYLLGKCSYDDMHKLFARRQSYGSHEYSFPKQFYEGMARNYRDGVKNRFDIKRDFLSDDEHKELFGWIDDCMFNHKPTGYAEFCVTLLADDFVTTLFSEDELQSIYGMVKNLDLVARSNEYSRCLKERYVSEAERQAELEAKKALAEEQARLARESQLQKLNEELASGYDGTLSFLQKFISSHCSQTEEVLAVVAEYFERTLSEKGYALNKVEIGIFVSLGMTLYRSDIISFERFKNYTSKVEELREDVEYDENN